MKKAVVWSLIVFTVSVCANSQEIAGGCGCPPPPRCAPPPPKCCTPPPPVCKVPKNPCRIVCDPCSLTPAAPLCDARMYLFLDAFYWTTYVGNLDLYYDQVDLTITNHQVDWGWSWGARLGLGYMSDGGWDAGLIYSWFQNLKSKRVQALSGSVLDYKVRFQLNTLDLELGSAHFLSRRLISRPNLGLKTAHIKHKFLRQPNPDQSSLMIFSDKIRLIGIGPMIGLNTKWMFSDSYFFVFADFQGALLWSKLKNSLSLILSTGERNLISNIDQRMVHPVTKAFMGLGLDTGLSNNSMYFGVRLGYEVQHWFRLNQLVRGVAKDADEATNNPNHFRYSDSVVFNGLTLQFRFDF